ncbi:MAG TPA: GNAT family N-acetyltransferase [Bryobacteraceae bacterium]
MPRIFHRMPADEDQYALFAAGAELYRRDVWSVIDQTRRPPQERRERSLKKAARHDLQIRESTDFAAFWEILSANLNGRYGLNPVHTLDEILLLQTRFPRNIRLFGAFQGSTMMAGAVAYDTGSAAHVQYNAASPEGKELGALDLLLETLISQTYSTHAYFDLGSSTETDGRYLNRGLAEQKEGFGARTIAHDFYRLDLTNWHPQRMECADRSTRPFVTE